MSTFPPPRKSLLAAGKLTVVLLIPIVAVVALLGGGAVLPATMGLLSISFVPYFSVREALGLSGILCLVGAAATAANGHPVAVVIVVVVVCLLAGLLSRVSGGVYAVAPSVAAVLGLSPSVDNSPLGTAAIMLAVCAYTIAVVHLLKLRLDREPVPFEVAIRHAVVMAVACGAATAVAVHYNWPRSYWLVMTLAIVLRPYAGDSLVKNRQRVVGTILGAAVAALLSPLPQSMHLVLTAVCLTLMLAYMVQRDYVLQVTFMTPMVIFLVSSGSAGSALAMDGLRVLYTIGAAVAGALLSQALVRESAVPAQS